MRAEYINPFIKSTVETFKTMVNLVVKPGRPYLHKDTDVNDVFGIINISGSLDGTIVMAYPKLTALKISSKFLGEDIRELNASAIDCIGELSNIISGFAKKDFQSLHIKISLPIVAQNREEVKTPKGAPIVCVPFESEVGTFVMEVSYF